MFLGMNDLKEHLEPSVENISNATKLMAKTILDAHIWAQRDSPKLLIMAPPLVTKLTPNNKLFHMSDTSIKVSRRLSAGIGAVARELGTYFLATENVIKTSDIDSVHFLASEHAKLGRAVAGIVSS